MVPPGPPTFTATVHVYEGPVESDHKAVGATVTVGDRTFTTDGAGNVDVPELPAGMYQVCSKQDGWKEACVSGNLPGPAFDVVLVRDVPPILPLVSDGRIFRTSDGQAWRYKGVSAFKLLKLYADGDTAAVDAFLEAYRGFNVLRVWPYVEWGANGWEPPSANVTRDFLAYVAARGWRVELTLLTSDEPARLAWAQAYLAALAIEPKPTNLLIEAGNEPDTGKSIDTAALIPALEASGFVWATGNYEDARKMRGQYGVAHTARSRDWPRRAHDLLEFYQGGGPNDPSDPPHRFPIVADEPAKPQDIPGGMTENDVLAYFGGSALMGAGATWHCEGCKYGRVPTADEARLAAAALRALDAFPADAPLGGYRRIVEVGQPAEARTYVIGSYMVRSQQNGTNSPEAGWTPIDVGGVLWRR